MSAPNPQPVIDTHAHFWDWPATRAAREHADEVVRLAPHAYGHGPFPPEALLAELDRGGVDKVVQVTPSILGPDNDQSLEGARRHPDRIRVIARVDTHAADVDREVAALVATDMVVGLRVFFFESEGRRLDDPGFARFVAAAGRHRLPLSLYAPNRTSEVRELAAANPGTTFVIDHLGIDLMSDPGEARRRTEWELLLGMADLPNVAVKASSLPEALPRDQVATLGAQRLREVVDAYGADRVLWGSNFPPAARAGTYPELVAMAREQCALLDPSETALVLGGTAIRILRLPW